MNLPLREPSEYSVAASLAALSQSPRISASDHHSPIYDSLHSEQKTSVIDMPSRVSTSTTIPRTAITSTSKVKQNFPQKLFGIISNPQFSDIITWLPGGDAWIILDKHRFTSQVLPAFFKQSQFASFLRKLSRWQFQRVKRGSFTGAYHHKYFQRDRRDLCLLMSCSNNDSPSIDVATVSQDSVSSHVTNDGATSHTVNKERMELQANVLKFLEQQNELLMQEQIMNIRLRKMQMLEKLRERSEKNAAKVRAANVYWRRIAEEPRRNTIQNSHGMESSRNLALNKSLASMLLAAEKNRMRPQKSKQVRFSNEHLPSFFSQTM